MEWSWLWDQLKVASPPVAVFCILAVAVLWRRHVQDIRAMDTLGRAQNRATLAISKSIAALRETVQRLADQNRDR